MITLAVHDNKHVAVHNGYPYREQLKEDFGARWEPAKRCWLLDLRLLPALYSALGDVIAPMPAEFWMELPLPASKQVKPKRRRRIRQTYEEQVKAAEVGRAIVEMKQEHSA